MFSAIFFSFDFFTLSRPPWAYSTSLLFYVKFFFLNEVPSESIPCSVAVSQGEGLGAVGLSD